MASPRFVIVLPAAAALALAAASTAAPEARAQSFDPDALEQWLEQDQFPQYPPVPRTPRSAPPAAAPAPPPPQSRWQLPGWGFMPPPPPPPPPPGYMPAPGYTPAPPPGYAGQPDLPVQPGGIVTGAISPTQPGLSPLDVARAGVDPDFPAPKIDLQTIKPEFRRQVVDYRGPEHPGTIIVDADNRHLYLVLEGGTALRYGVGVGREGFEWQGRARIARKAKWPSWHPPAEMVARDPKAAPWANGMPGGPDNPLGARALYLYDENGKDTLYRIHGTNDPQSIGKAMSSGCIRMLNEDVAELFLRAPVGTPVVVLSSKAPGMPTAQAAPQPGAAPQPY
jgi:lipoprotein-anchoring transpeptidase ErfK/SrfK